MGMNPQNGYIYAVRATQGDPDYVRATWSSYTGHIQILKYGSMGVDNLGPIQGLPNTYWAQLGPNYNGAAFNPKTGELLIANWQTGESEPPRELRRLVGLSAQAGTVDCSASWR